MTAVGRYSVDDVPQDPDSWRARCLVSLHQAPSARHTSFDIKFKLLKVVEEKLLEEARSKLRSKLMKAVEHKKEREVKYTDRVPPPKRARTGCTHFNHIYTRSLINAEFHPKGIQMCQQKLYFRKLGPTLQNFKKTFTTHVYCHQCQLQKTMVKSLLLHRWPYSRLLQVE